MLHVHRATNGAEEIGPETSARRLGGRPNQAQRWWLVRGLNQAGGKLPLFDRDGRRVSPQMVRACLDAGWAEPWFRNPLKPDWVVCKLTESGRRVLEAELSAGLYRGRLSALPLIGTIAG